MFLFMLTTIITRDNDNYINPFKFYLRTEFSIKNLDPLRFLLGIEVSRFSYDIFMSTKIYF